MISIVVPVYNAEKYLNRCVQSILSQTVTDWELLLIENGSSDGSLSLCECFAKEDHRIHVFHEDKNQGVSVARNVGIEKSKGEYVTFIDADDWIRPDFLEQLMKLQQESDVKMVVCEYEKSWEAISNRDTGCLTTKATENSIADNQLSVESDPQKADNRTWEYTMYDTKQYLEQYLLQGNTHCWGVLYQRGLLDGITFPKGVTIGEDLLFLLDVALKTEKVLVTSYPGYYYYQNTAGAMNQTFKLSYMDQITCWQHAKGKIVPLYPHLADKVNSIIVVSALLVVGKLSILSRKERKQYQQQQRQCLDIVRQYGKSKRVKKLLPAGYPIKVALFSNAPELYLKLYGTSKR